MEGLQVFGPAHQFIEAKLDVFLGERASAMTAQVAGPLRAALVLYVLLYGFAILRGAIGEPLIDFAVRSVKLSLIYVLATSSAYSSFITEPLFHALPAALAQGVGGDAPDVGAAFDQFLARAAFLAERIAAEASLTDVGLWIVSAVVFLAGALTAAVGFGVASVAKVALALLIALGPAFIGCALFEATRRFFFGWLAQAVNYLVLFALMLAILQLVLSLVFDQWSQIEGADPVAGGFVFIALCLLAGVFFLQVPALASGIAGGASAGLADFAAAGRLGGQRPAERAPLIPPAPRSGGALRPLGGRG